MELMASISGKNYRYLKLGSGQRKLLLLWGFASYKESPLRLVQMNFSEYTVLIPDYPYHNNFEDACLDITSIMCIAGYLWPLLQHENFLHFSGIGFSLGGLVLMDLLNNYRSLQVDKAVIWSSPLLGYGGITEIPKQLASVYAKMPEERLEIIHQNKLIQHTLLTRGIKVFNPLYFKKYLTVFKSYKLVSLAKTSKYLFIYDPKDKFISHANIKYLLTGFDAKSYSLVKIVGGGHFGTRAGWDKAVEEIKGFLRNN